MKVEIADRRWIGMMKMRDDERVGIWDDNK